MNEEVEEEEEKQKQEQEPLDLNCHEDFETAEIVLGNWKYCLPGPAQEAAAAAATAASGTEEKETQYQKWLRHAHSTKDETLEDYLNLQSPFEIRRRDSSSNVEDYDYLNLQITFERKRRDSI